MELAIPLISPAKKRPKTSGNIASHISFVNSNGILGCLFSHRSHDLQVLCWHSVYPLSCPVCIRVSASNNFLAGLVHILFDCNLFLGGSSANAFWFNGGVPMSAVLSKSRFFKFLPFLQHYGIAFVDQLYDHHGSKRLDFYGPISDWFRLSAAFFNGVISFFALSSVSNDVGSLNIFGSGEFLSVCDHFSHVETGCLFVYTDGSLRNLGTVSCKAGTAAFFENIGLGLGVGISGVMSSTLAELQAIVLALECVPPSSSVCLFSDSQFVLDACKLELGLLHPDFYIKSHSGVERNKQTDVIAGSDSLSSWFLLSCLDKCFLVANDVVISDVFCSISRACWKISSGVKFLASDLVSEIDWSHFSLVWHPDLHMAAGFTSRVLANMCTYFMKGVLANMHTYFIKALHYQLSVAVRKCLYNRSYLSVLCLYYSKIEMLDHVFSCEVNNSAWRWLLESHMKSWKALSGLFHSLLNVLHLLSSCVSGSLVLTTLYKGFVFNNWFHEAVLVFHNPKVASLKIVEFAFCVKHCAYMEKNRLIPLDSLIPISLSGLSLKFSAGVVNLLGVVEAFSISFGYHKCCLFFSGIGDSVSVHIAV
ncbi:hypothetical protein G9A89_001992 [Geosiphon pyriformis]|nr:hypothetical protein G9A89_001992 [Geosiphon pyriformis]